MKVTYALWDKDEEPLLDIKGNKYIAKIGEQVDFYDNIDGNQISYSGIVDSIQYSTYEDEVTVNCICVQDLHTRDNEDISNYNEAKSIYR
jgi:hypothetical protein